ncbi:hypothetical protein F6X86_12585 [Enterococcus durans]|uniref:Uncharacterized protein n=1 Tax=Enterococcus durans TaxID=53345 RepID=A0A5N0YQC2_9ENTE|nr:hypothetical protein [Enterococcus durans]KAA9177086.1 hypothetical protein F6X86_12585 [Enterococcus durans]KAA9185229.1 hypothetical protein F6X85_08110 [Enterococcus durans]KAA9186040.1 hypothetical protein F6X90_07505 [Enterococcus durans]KAA9190714.1 hypothetical protein F6Y12_07790 [Enterococcus durans]KAA9192655.1 hypothetical protein F6X88_08190 [Enterococcus durans]
MEAKISLEPFERILSGYQKIEELAVNVADCSKLAQKYARYGVEGYCLGNYVGTGYLNRYLECMVDRAPMLTYKRNYLIPLLFRRSDSAYQLFEEDYRMEAFFRLLEWSLKHQPGKILIEKNEKYDLKKAKVIDSAYLAFRVSEILDSGGYPLSNFQTLEQFIEWNRIYRLIDNGGIGRHSKLFDPEYPENMEELRMIISLVKLKYPDTELMV